MAKLEGRRRQDRRQQQILAGVEGRHPVAQLGALERGPDQARGGDLALPARASDQSGIGIGTSPLAGRLRHPFAFARLGCSHYLCGRPSSAPAGSGKARRPFPPKGRGGRRELGPARAQSPRRAGSTFGRGSARSRSGAPRSRRCRGRARGAWVAFAQDFRRAEHDAVRSGDRGWAHGREVTPFLQKLGPHQHGKIFVHRIVAMLHIRSAALTELHLELDLAAWPQAPDILAHEFSVDGIDCVPRFMVTPSSK